MATSSKIIIGTLAALAIAGTFTSCSDKKETVKKKAAPVVVEVALPPPPPPPPPPPKPEEPKPEEPKEQEMVEQEPIVEETPPEPAPADEPPALGTNMAPGDGPDNGYGLAKGGGTGGGRGSNSIGGKGGSRFGRQASMIQNTVAGELRRNPKTKSAVFSGKVALWVDASGRITRAKAVGSLGGSGVDESVPSVLVGLQFPEALPSDMPMPVQMRVSGRKVN